MKSEPNLGGTTPACSDRPWYYMGGRPLAVREEGWDRPSGLLHWGVVLSGQCQAFALCEGCDLWVKS